MPTIASCSRHVCHELKCEFCCYESRFGTTCQVCLFASRPTPETPLQTMRVKSMMSCTPLQDRAGSRGRLKALTMVVSLTALAFFSRSCHSGNQQDLHFLSRAASEAAAESVPSHGWPNGPISLHTFALLQTAERTRVQNMLVHVELALAKPDSRDPLRCSGLMMATGRWPLVGLLILSAGGALCMHCYRGSWVPVVDHQALLTEPVCAVTMPKEVPI